MYSAPRKVDGFSAAKTTQPVDGDRFARTEERPRRAQPLMRRYEVVHLLPNGDIDEFNRIAPAHPAFEDAFTALARGALLSTDRGTVAIEDILPGDKVKTVTNGFQTVKWRGSASIVPNTRGQSQKMGQLIRFSADALGIGRPMPDLMLGPSARLYHRTPGIQQITGHDAAFVPAADFVDGINIIHVTPPTPVQVFQLAFDAHERIVANGVELDSYNPGARHELGLRGDMLDLYLSLFPQVSSLDDFGLLMHPRMSLRDIDLFDVA